MKIQLIYIAVLILLPIAAMAQLSDEQMEHNVETMARELSLIPFINQIQQGKFSDNQTAIVYLILKHTTEVHIHQQNGAIGNQVFVHKDGHSEAVFDKNKELVKDGVNDGSYNYFHPSEQPLRHFSFDISPWIMWGHSRTDSTTVKSRIYAFMGDCKTSSIFPVGDNYYSRNNSGIKSAYLL